MSFLEEEFRELQSGKSNVNEFVRKINPLINELIFEQKWKYVIGSNFIESLTKLLINLNTRLKTYNSLTQLGDDQKANVESNNLEVVATHIIGEIGSAIENQSILRNYSDMKLTKKEDNINQDLTKQIDTEDNDNIQVFVSKPSALNPSQALFCSTLLTILNTCRIHARILGETDYSDLAPLLAVKEVMNECDGAIILGMKQIYILDCIDKQGTDRELKRNNIFLPTPWNQLEAGMACFFGIPLLIICEKGIEDGIFDQSVSGHYIHRIDISSQKLSIDWLKSDQFTQPFKRWLNRVQQNKHK